MIGRDQTQPHVLVVDDHPGIARALSDMVERAGFGASCALGGKEGIAAVNLAVSAGSPFSVVITDFSMPDLDGLAVAAAVKAASPATAVVLLTAHKIDIQDVPPDNVDALLMKPPSDAQMRSTLARLIDPGAKRHGTVREADGQE